MSYPIKFFSQKPKFHNTITTTGGIRYHSKLEARYAQDLAIKKKTGLIRGWRRQVRIDLKAYDQHICYYAMDFIVEHNDGSFEMVECKGYQTALWELKWKLLNAMMQGSADLDKEYPGLKLTLYKK